MTRLTGVKTACASGVTVVVKVVLAVIGSRQLPNQPYLAQEEVVVVTVEVIGWLVAEG